MSNSETGATHEVRRNSDQVDADTLSYKLNFVELNNRNVSERWSSRHLGVYHQHEADFDLYVLIHCSRSSALYNRFTPKSMSSHGQHGQLKDIVQDPGSLHDLILQAYVHNWRPYLRSWGNELAKMVRVLRLLNWSKFQAHADNIACRIIKPWWPRSQRPAPRAMSGFAVSDRSKIAWTWPRGTV